MKYSEYFDVNESYFPCIDESAIKAGASWEATYPHETFISLLNDVEKMLAGSTKRSVWIHGAYGTRHWYNRDIVSFPVNFNNENLYPKGGEIPYK